MMNLRSLWCSLLLLVGVAVASAQNYTPAAGETVMKIAIEGRGNIFVHLYTKEAPKATAHIIKLAKANFYDGQRFHKVIKSPRPFLVQVGDPDSKTKNIDDPSLGSGGTGTRVPYEQNSLSNEEGMVGLATLSKDRDSGDSQFYMLLAPAKFLDGSYTVFGKIVQGKDILQKIEKGDRVQSVTILGG